MNAISTTFYCGGGRGTGGSDCGRSPRGAVRVGTRTGNGGDIAGDDACRRRRGIHGLSRWEPRRCRAGPAREGRKQLGHLVDGAIRGADQHDGEPVRGQVHVGLAAAGAACRGDSGGQAVAARDVVRRDDGNQRDYAERHDDFENGSGLGENYRSAEFVLCQLRGAGRPARRVASGRRTSRLCGAARRDFDKRQKRHQRAASLPDRVNRRAPLRRRLSKSRRSPRCDGDD